MALDLANEVVIRWNDPDPRHVPLLKDGGITVVWGPSNDAFQSACASAGIATAAPDVIRAVSPEELDRVPPGTPVAVSAGLWPGVRGRDPAVASATRRLWVDANGYRIAYLRALYPGVPPVLGYLPNADAGVPPDRIVPFETLELALVDAWAAGGNYILALEPRYRDALLRGEETALSAWRSLGRTARWLREHTGLFRQSPLPIVTVLVDRGELSAEVANLMYRQSVSPAIEPAANPPAPDPARRLVVVAAGIGAPSPEIAERILAHARAGSIVVVDPAERAWWQGAVTRPIKSQEDRDFYALGKGQVVGYKEAVSDPSELALDVIDLVTQNGRPTRLWNCPGCIALATSGEKSVAANGRAVLHIVNYASPVDLPVLARIQGTFTRATVLRPDRPPLEAKVAKRGTSSEVMVSDLARAAVVVFR